MEGSRNRILKNHLLMIAYVGAVGFEIKREQALSNIWNV